jgi:hypothetical protein
LFLFFLFVVACVWLGILIPLSVFEFFLSSFFFVLFCFNCYFYFYFCFCFFKRIGVLCRIWVPVG